MTEHGKNDAMDAALDSARKPRRRWWPMLIGAAVAATALVGVIVLRSGDEAIAPTTAPTTTPTAPTTAPTTPTTDPASVGASVVVDGPCITVVVGDTSATGCPQTGTEFAQLEQRVFVANLDGPVVAVSASADPFADLSAAVDEAGDVALRCQWDELAAPIPDGGLIELVTCNSAGVMGLDVVGLVNAGDAEPDRLQGYFTLPTPFLPDGADLGSGTPVDGLPGALAFTAPVEDVTTCSLLLLPDRSGWKEACGFIHGLELTTALVQIDPAESTVHEIAVDESGVITSARLLDAMAPSSGCSIESTNDLVRALPASSVVMGIGCIDDKASLTTGSVLTQEGPPDGSIRLALRGSDGTWTITDNGTGIDDFSFPIAPVAVWESWPESTVPGFRSFWWEPIVAIPPQATVDAFADALLATLATLDTEPEFPLNARLVDVQPAGLPLIIAQVDTGGDDSVAGAVIYVWLDEVYDDAGGDAGGGPVGWRAGEVLAGEVCARGETVGQELCI